jgi:LysR family transcriptional regulator, mexEF-oprN operon transcriptional activator
MNLAMVDLNLIVAFDSLMREQNVTRAGRKIGLSQPAMSGALARLRQLLEDELFVRRGDRMVPTARAAQIAEHFRAALAEIDVALSPATYDPTSSRRQFRIACNDLGAAVLIPPLIERLSILAPHVEIVVVHADSKRAVELLSRDEIDMAAGHHPGQCEQIETATLFHPAYACAARVGHPLAGKPLDFGDMSKLSYVVVDHSGDPNPEVDQIFSRNGLHRRIALNVPHYLAVPHFLYRTDYVSFIPRKMIQQFDRLIELTMGEDPLQRIQGHAVLFWHASKPHDEGNAWVRSLLLSLAKEGELDRWQKDRKFNVYRLHK